MGVLGAMALGLGGKTFAASTIGKALSGVMKVQALGKGNNAQQSFGSLFKDEDEKQQLPAQLPTAIPAATGTPFPTARNANLYMNNDATDDPLAKQKILGQNMSRWQNIWG